jgi:cytochrome oxidase Cu insertion factor (SCO1/SenC/PrrC family)
MSENVQNNRINLWLIGALCVAPVIASYLAFYLMRPQAHTNYGELMQTRPLPDVHLRLADGTPFQLTRLKGKWILLMVDAGGCDEFCRRKLFTLRQLRLTQGKDMERIERAWLISDDVMPSADTVNAYAGTWLVRAAGSELLRQLPAVRSPADHIYVVDPLGNLVLRYARDADPAGIIKDLARLLKISRIG